MQKAADVLDSLRDISPNRSSMSLAASVRRGLIVTFLFAAGIGSCRDNPVEPRLGPRDPAFALNGPAVSIDAGNYHSCAIGSDGKVACWGENGNGQASVPATLGTATQVSAGSGHTCAIKSDGSVACWGNDFNGQASVPATLGTATGVSAGSAHTCAITSDGDVVCWGLNASGQASVPAALGTATQVSAGSNHTCAIKIDGIVVCWGDNGNGQATPPVALGTVIQVSAGAFHTCAVKTDGSVACWGRNLFGEGIVPATLGTVTQVSAGSHHNCAVKSDGTAACWGANGVGESSVPASLGAATHVTVGQAHSCALDSEGSATCWGAAYGGLIEGSFSDVSPGGSHACALRSDGNVACWGQNGSGQTSVPTALGTATQVSAGWAHTCAVKSDGIVSCWGNNGNGQTTVPPDLGAATQVSAGSYHTCAVKTDGNVVCWGDNGSGQAGVPAALGTATKVSAGTFHTCAIKSGGSVECWGDNTYGQTAAPAGSATQVTVGLYHTCALKSDGSVSCWGRDPFGEASVPTGLGSATQVSAGSYHTCAIKGDGTVACWGRSTEGQANVPSDLGSAIRLSAGSFQSCVVKSDHAIECWGGPTSTTFVPPAPTVPLILSQGPRTDDEGNSLRSNVSVGPGSVETTQQIADGFTLATSSQLDHVSWEGSYFQTPLSLPTVAFRIQIYTDLAQPPLFDAVVNAGYTQVGTSGYGSPIYQFSASVAGPVLNANVQYWIAIIDSDANTSIDFRWWKTATEGPGDFAIRNSGDQQWYTMNSDDYHDFTFALAGSAAPDPIPESFLSAGGSHVCARDSNGILSCWGANNYGQTDVPTGLGSTTQVSAGGYHTCAINSTGGVVCWGYGGEGQTSVPTTLGIVTQLTAGERHNCAIKSGGNVVCWGADGGGQINVPTNLGLTRQVSAGRLHTCALKADRTIVCWGNSATGQTSVPPTMGPATEVASGGFHTCALRSDSGVTCWGATGFGVPAGLTNVRQVSAGGYHTCALKNDGSISCWGSSNTYGQSNVPTDLGTVIEVRAGWEHTCALKADYSVKCWGNPASFAQAGPGATPVGSGVTVSPVDQTTEQPAPVNVTFGTVTSAGQTTVTSGTVGQTGGTPAPSGFRLGSPPTYYDVQTTATFTGAIILCFNYSGASFGNENNLKLLHFESNIWTDVTTSLDTDNNVICGTVTSLSPFIVAEPNAAPVVMNVGLPAAPVPIGTAVTATAGFTDANPNDTHTATVDWNNGVTTNGSVTESNGSGSVSAAHAYLASGVYTVSTSVSDGDLTGSRSSGSDQPAYVVVYDPSGGFVTGGGWFDSPANACTWTGCAGDGSTSGKATFGFVSRYQRGATTPTGNTEFQFKAGGLTFRSTRYQWLVVAGARAQYKGEGQIAGDGATYGFLVTAIDGALVGGDAADRFRIKLWSVATGAVVYDNQMGQLEDSDEATAISGGSIVIHK